MKKIIIASVITLFATTGVASAQVNEDTADKKPAPPRAEQSTINLPKAEESGATSSVSAQGRAGGKADEHRSEVAKFVQTLLGASARMGGIGEEVRKIASEQASSTEKVASAVEKVEKRNKIKTFLIGSDYKNLGAIRSEIVTTENRLQRLSREVERMASSSDKTAVAAEIASLEQEQVRIEVFVKSNESKFSIFGWAVRLFQK